MTASDDLSNDLALLDEATSPDPDLALMDEYESLALLDEYETSKAATPAAPAKAQPFKRGFFEEIGAGFVRGTGQFAESFGGMAKMVGADTVGDYFKEAGETTVANFPPSEGMATFEPSNPNWWAANISASAPQLAAQLGAAFLTRGRSVPLQLAAFAGTGAGLMAGDAYNEALAARMEKGQTEEEARPGAVGEAVTVGVLGGALDLIPGAEFLTKNPVIRSTIAKVLRSKLAPKLLGGALAEGLTEVGQEVVSDLSALGFRGETKQFENAWERYKASFTVGAALGGAVGGVVDVRDQQKTDREAAEFLKGVRTSALQQMVDDPRFAETSEYSAELVRSELARREAEAARLVSGALDTAQKHANTAPATAAALANKALADALKSLETPAPAPAPPAPAAPNEAAPNWRLLSWGAWSQLSTDERDLLQMRLQRVFEKKGALQWSDLPTDILNKLGTAELTGLKAAMAADPQAAIDALVPKPAATADTARATTAGAEGIATPAAPAPATPAVTAPATPAPAQPAPIPQGGEKPSEEILQRQEGRQEEVLSPAVVVNETSPTPVVVNETPVRESQTSVQDIVPAIRVAGQVVRGNKGDTHQDILNRYVADNPDAAADALIDFDTKENPNFFVAPDGTEISRDELQTRFGVRDSQGLRRIQTETAPPPTTTAIVPANAPVTGDVEVLPPTTPIPEPAPAPAPPATPEGTIPAEEVASVAPLTMEEVDALNGGEPMIHQTFGAVDFLERQGDLVEILLPDASRRVVQPFTLTPKSGALPGRARVRALTNRGRGMETIELPATEAVRQLSVQEALYQKLLECLSRK